MASFYNSVVGRDGSSGDLPSRAITKSDGLPQRSRSLLNATGGIVMGWQTWHVQPMAVSGLEAFEGMA